MQNLMTTWRAGLILALMAPCFAASAQASTIYNFTFTEQGNSSHVVGAGSFTTSGPAVDPGYELLQSLTFDQLDIDGTIYGPITTTGFEPGAAYNPTTGEFLNHAQGNTYPNPGGELDFSVGAFIDITVQGFSFTPGEHLLAAESRDFRTNHRDSSVWDTDLTITPAAAPAVPEPTTLLLFGTGLIAVSRVRRRV